MEKNKEKSEKKDLLNADEARAKIMLEELKLKYPIFNNTNLNEDDVIKTIIKLNFDEDKIKDYYDVDKIFDEIFNNDIGCPCGVDEEQIKDIILKLNLDTDRIIDWIENHLVAGDY